VFLVVIVTVTAPSVHGQAGTGIWTPPLNIFETEGRASEAEVVADPSGTIHAFWAYGGAGNEESGASQAIYYSHNSDDSWSVPVDVLVSPGNLVARMHSVVADSQGYLHIVWSGGNVLFYSRANALEAGRAGGWIKPLALASGAGAFEPSITVDGQDWLYIVWTEPGRGLMFAKSDSGGSAWTNPQTIFNAYQDNELARWGRIAVDDSGRLHVALTEEILLDGSQVDGRNDPNYLFYLRSEDGGKTWSGPLEVTPEPDFGEVNVATFGEDTVHLVWNGRASRRGRYHRWSQDGGQTWSNVVEILAPAPQNYVGTGGLTGFPALATDATGALHMVSATGGGDYYFRWAKGAWSQPVNISPGLDGNGVTGTRNSLEQPSSAISEGNQLHVVFHDGFERIWYTRVAIDAPFESPTVLPTPSDSAIAEPTSTPTINQEPTAVAALPAQVVPPSSSPFSPLLAGIVAAVLLIGAVVLVAISRRGRSHY
jgi:hypothetical protein